MRLTTITVRFSHIHEVLKKAGIEATRVNGQDLYRVIHGGVGVEHKYCPATKREVKKRAVRKS